MIYSPILSRIGLRAGVRCNCESDFFITKWLPKAHRSAPLTAILGVLPQEPGAFPGRRQTSLHPLKQVKLSGGGKIWQKLGGGEEYRRGMECIQQQWTLSPLLQVSFAPFLSSVFHNNPISLNNYSSPQFLTCRQQAVSSELASKMKFPLSPPKPPDPPASPCGLQHTYFLFGSISGWGERIEPLMSCPV